MDYSKLKVDNIEEGVEGALLIDWSCPGVGFGEYTLRPTDDGWDGLSECMDKDDNKSLLEAIFRYIVQHAHIIE